MKEDHILVSDVTDQVTKYGDARVAMIGFPSVNNLFLLRMSDFFITLYDNKMIIFHLKSSKYFYLFSLMFLGGKIYSFDSSHRVRVHRRRL